MALFDSRKYKIEALLGGGFIVSVNVGLLFADWYAHHFSYPTLEAAEAHIERLKKYDEAPKLIKYYK